MKIVNDSELSSIAMTGVESADERRIYPEPCSPSSSSARSSPDNSCILQPLLTSSNSNTSSPPPPHLLEALTPSTIHSSFTPFAEPDGPSVKTEACHNVKTEECVSSWSMHLDVLR